VKKLSGGKIEEKKLSEGGKIGGKNCPRGGGKIGLNCLGGSQEKGGKKSCFVSEGVRKIPVFVQG